MILAFLLVLVVIANGANEGESCIKDGVAGVCANIRTCPAAHEDIKNRREPQICDFGGEDPIVCCVSSDSDTPATDIRKKGYTATFFDFYDKDEVPDELCDPIPDSLTSKPTGRKAWDMCLEYQKVVFPCAYHYNYHVLPIGSGWSGYSRSNRCHHDAVSAPVQGLTEPHEFPHMALIGYGNDTDLDFFCTGSLISDQFVLTAGYCAYDQAGEPVTFVQLGTFKRSRKPDKYRYAVNRIILHPEYKPPLKDHDIALLELEKPVPLDEATVPACLHVEDEEEHHVATVTGWGNRFRGQNFLDTLEQKILNHVNKFTCEYIYSDNKLLKQGFHSKSQICYAASDIFDDVCQRLNGCPLQIKNKKIACMYTILGVTSFGTTCGDGAPGIYMRVEHYVDWIESIVWPAETN